MAMRTNLALGAALAFSALGAALAQAPDPLTNLARDATAVLGSGADARIVLTETAHGVESTRILAIGEEYLDGWTIEAVVGRSVTVKKGEQKRTFALLGRPVPVGAPPPVSVAAPIIANNAPPPRAIGPQPQPEGAFNQAQAAARAAQSAGASVQEIARIYTSLNPGPAGQVADPSSARWVNIGGQPMIAMIMRDSNSGRESRMMMASPDGARAPSVKGLPTLQDLPPLTAPQPPPIPIGR
jgi:hypothetical protein